MLSVEEAVLRFKPYVHVICVHSLWFSLAVLYVTSDILGVWLHAQVHRCGKITRGFP